MVAKPIPLITRLFGLNARPKLTKCCEDELA